ncbi:MAG: tripartite tricarboxylate transporter substrate binding protein [Betaproteobacteria bacterium]|nr:MAG: tripartite tricarboxylate transporter substrate binding protein [Betaproteobacteria bacterium]
MRALLFATLLASLPLHAQDWPAKAVRIIVPFPAGGSADLLPRVVAEKLTEKWGQPVIVDNRPGAAGNIGADAVFRAEPDGYTLLSSPPPPLVINKLLYPKLSYDSAQFVPITVIGAIPNVLLVHPKVGANSVAELIAIAKQNPGKLNYASQGSGTTSHLTAELFKAMAGGLQIAHIPYKGTAPALTDLLAGQVDMMCDNLGVSLPHVRSGKLKALAVASRNRFAGLPKVPALAETLPGFESVAWFGIVAPPKTNGAIVEKIAAAVQEALKLPEVQKRLADLSAEPMGLGPGETAAFMRQEVERWGAVIRTAGVKLE